MKTRLSAGCIALMKCPRVFHCPFCALGFCQDLLIIYLIWLLAVVSLPGTLGNLHVGEDCREG